MKDWLRLKHYVHISPKFPTGDKRLRRKSKTFISSYVKDPANILKHRFFPFIHYKIIEHKFKRDKTIILSNKKIGRSYKVKPRPIFYANHLDAHVFAYYANAIHLKLKDVYEENTNLNESVIGYRAIKYDENRNKCTIDFAKEVFEYVKFNSAPSLTVVCLDISSFFDNINHDVLRKAWCHINNGSFNLKEDEYKVFKAITQGFYIDLEELIPLLPNFDKKRINLINKSKKKSLFQSSAEFRSILREHNLLKKYDVNNQKKGIPQGTPISAVLSNLYFLNVDKAMCDMVYSSEGLYRRYSDDILIAGPSYTIEPIIDKLRSSIAELDLSIQEKKTVISTLRKDNVGMPWTLFDRDGIKTDKPISYLGFDFDGTTVKIRNSSLSKYYRSLKRAIRRRAFYAKIQRKRNEKEETQKDAWIFRTRIFKGKTHLGSKRKKINGKVSWGNYISYVQNAAKIIDDKNGKSIKKQLKNHWKIVNSEIKKFEEQYKLPKPPKKEILRWCTKNSLRNKAPEN